MEYDRTEQVKRCRAILDTVLPILDEPHVADAIRKVASHSAVNYQKISGAVADMLMEEAVGFKDAAFSVEKEWRLVARRRELLKQGSDDGGKSGIPVHFRAAGGYLVPYVRLVPAAQSPKIPLRIIRSGPTLDRLAVVLSVGPFLDSNGLRNVPLEHSEIWARS